jgi:hypothetical protein
VPKKDRNRRSGRDQGSGPGGTGSGPGAGGLGGSEDYDWIRYLGEGKSGSSPAPQTARTASLPRRVKAEAPSSTTRGFRRSDPAAGQPARSAQPARFGESGAGYDGPGGSSGFGPESRGATRADASSDRPPRHPAPLDEYAAPLYEDQGGTQFAGPARDERWLDSDIYAQPLYQDSGPIPVVSDRRAEPQARPPAGRADSGRRPTRPAGDWSTGPSPADGAGGAVGTGRPDGFGRTGQSGEFGRPDGLGRADGPGRSGEFSRPDGLGRADGPGRSGEFSRPEGLGRTERPGRPDEVRRADDATQVGLPGWPEGVRRARRPAHPDALTNGGRTGRRDARSAPDADGPRDSLAVADPRERGDVRPGTARPGPGDGDQPGRRPGSRGRAGADGPGEQGGARQRYTAWPNNLTDDDEAHTDHSTPAARPERSAPSSAPSRPSRPEPASTVIEVDKPSRPAERKQTDKSGSRRAPRGKGTGRSRPSSKLKTKDTQLSQQATSRKGLAKAARKLPRTILITGSVAVVAAIAIVVWLLLPPPSHVISVPATVGGYVKQPTLANTTAVQLRAKIIAGARGEVKNVVAAVYERKSGPGTGAGPQVIVFIGGNLAGGTSASDLISAYMAELHDAFTTSPGSLGGQAACAPGLHGGPAECAWADNDTFGVVVSATMNADGLAAQMRQMRLLVEHVSR